MRSLFALTTCLSFIALGCGGQAAPSGVADDSVPADLASPRPDIAGCNPPCAQPTPFCNARLQCVVCQQDTDCAPGSVCRMSDAATACVPGCKDDSHCPMGQKCCAGACTDLAVDVMNCGGCGMPCSVAHAQAACAGGTCKTARCDANWADCNADPKDGCEVFLPFDVNNCSACGLKCNIPNALAACSGTCYLKACLFGFDDCNGDQTDGCETSVLSDVKNCGGCGAGCNGLPNAKVACVQANCAIAACKGNFLDCDRSSLNGCEVNGDSDPNNCGGCGNSCPQGLVCRSAKCTCPQCQIPNASTKCVNNVCMFDQCNAGFGDCDGDIKNGCEVSLASDARNCGKCGNACPGMQSCSQSTCVNIPANPFFDGMPNATGFSVRGPGDACGTNILVNQNVNVAAISVSANLKANGNIRFIIFSHPNDMVLYVSPAKPFNLGPGWRQSDAINFMLQAGTMYCISGIADVSADWDYTTNNVNQGGVQSLQNNPNLTNFNSPVVGGHGGANCGIRLY